mmetsp:Transcript_53403/g.68540  ORF Transcript_53403/g.68540 Transcript_53403/m.68540 type:complete len:87 (+) Transcript_53403:91-351(+)
MESTKKQKPLLHILCYGDSLTEGFCQHGQPYSPYSYELMRELNDKFNYGVSCLSLGFSGKKSKELMIMMSKYKEFFLKDVDLLIIN